MPPKRNPVAPVATRPARIAKTKGGKLITAAIRGIGRPPAASPPPRESASPPPFDVDALGAVISTLPQIQGLDDHFRNLESIIDENQREFRSSLQDTFTQFMDRFDALEQRGTPSTPPTPTRQGQGNPVPFSAPRDVLSRWTWVDQKLVEDISSGKFDIHSLPKLHRDEEPRNANAKKTTEGLHIPADGGMPQIVTGRTKMLDAFPNMATFSSAWMIYVSIRSSYDLERGPALSYWTERLVHYYQGFEWSACLSYTIAYFMKHQNASPEPWYSTDPELVTEHFVGAKRNSSIAPPQRSKSSSKKPYDPSNSVARSTDVCQNWNRPVIGCTYKARFEGDICGRKHLCSTCHKRDHKAFECPDKPKPSN